MVQRQAKGLPARITFTRDFHELLTGDLCRGRPLHIAYDPLRIVPPEASVKCGEPSRPVTLHARFRDGGEEVALALVSPAGIVAEPTDDASRRACLVEGVLPVPADAESVSLWFTYPAPDGERHDDDYGATFRFRFPCDDLTVDRAEVIPLPAGGGAAFVVEVDATGSIERLRVRYRLVGDGTPQSGESEFSPGEVIAGGPSTGRRRWTSPLVAVPVATIVRFKLFYWIGGVRYKDDDGGHYYLAPDPQRVVPPPPAALLTAATAWVW